MANDEQAESGGQSAEAVAWEMAMKIAAAEGEIPEKEKPREYWIGLFKQCLLAVRFPAQNRPVA